MQVLHRLPPLLAGAAALCLALASGHPRPPELASCEAPAHTTAGWVCGARRRDLNGDYYSSFRGVPYAKQPLGELRFKELQPPEPWEGVLNTIEEGPICPQTDVFYGKLVKQGREMSEACIHANIHVPEVPPHPLGENYGERKGPGLPVLVFIHGGGFAFGSGDADLHGPEYLVSKRVIVITFNYRLNVFGFLSLNSPHVPGNMGVRDARTLLRWVQANVASFGGDPARVTLAGQSAGAAIAHILSLAPDAKDLMSRVMLFSGTAFSEFFSSSPTYAQMIAGQFLSMLNVSAALPPEEVHRRLVNMPLDKIMAANTMLISVYGLATFTPVVESVHEGVSSVLEADPGELVSTGRGARAPLLVAFTSAECESFRARFHQLNVTAAISEDPRRALTLRLMFMTPPDVVPAVAAKIIDKYFSESESMDNYVWYCTESAFKYPALRLARMRAAPGTAATVLLRFSYGGRGSPFKEALGITAEGAAHVEDITYLFRANAALGGKPEAKENLFVAEQMTNFVVDFMRRPEPARQGVSFLEMGASGVRPGSLTPQEVAAEGLFRHIYHMIRKTNDCSPDDSDQCNNG